MLKALIVTHAIDAGTTVTEGETLKMYRGNHDLVAISEHARMPLSVDEKELLARMSTFVLWGGRYPVGMSKEKTDQDRVAISDDWQRISLFVGRVDKELRGMSWQLRHE